MHLRWTKCREKLKQELNTRGLWVKYIGNHRIRWKYLETAWLSKGSLRKSKLSFKKMLKLTKCSKFIKSNTMIWSTTSTTSLKPTWRSSTNLETSSRVSNLTTVSLKDRYISTLNWTVSSSNLYSKWLMKLTFSNRKRTITTRSCTLLIKCKAKWYKESQVLKNWITTWMSSNKCLTTWKMREKEYLISFTKMSTISTRKKVFKTLSWRSRTISSKIVSK